jgi:hypothetical protein
LLLIIFNIVNMINLQLNIEPKCLCIGNYFYDYFRKKEWRIFRRTAKIGGCSLETVQNIQGILNTHTSINTKKRLTQNRIETVSFYWDYVSKI